MNRDRELLEQSADALWKCAKSALTVKPSLDQPYPDAPEWTPYTRWVEQPARRAHDLAMAIRKHLREGTGGQMRENQDDGAADRAAWREVGDDPGAIATIILDSAAELDQETSR